MVKGAWVTLATNDSYSLGALVLAHSLKQVGTQKELAILITPGVTNSMRSRLSEVFNSVKEVNILDSKDKANLKLLQRPELGITFTKLHCWQLTEYEKCVFLDADTLVLQNCDELFEREELSAAPDVGWPDCFNSGVFVYRPSEETYNSLVQFALDKGSFDGGDQGLLNLYFSDWAQKDISKHLPFIYNVCSTAFYSYLPAFKQFGKDIKIIHFIGNAKPWLQYFDTESKTVRPSRDLGHLEPILQMWWNIFCSMIHPNLSTDMSGLAGAFARLTLGQQRTPEQEELENCLRRQNWEQGNIDYLGRDSFDNIWSKICQTLAKGPQEDEGGDATQIKTDDLLLESPQQEVPKEDVPLSCQEAPQPTESSTDITAQKIASTDLSPSCPPTNESSDNSVEKPPSTPAQVTTPVNVPSSTEEISASPTEQVPSEKEPRKDTSSKTEEQALSPNVPAAKETSTVEEVPSGDKSSTEEPPKPESETKVSVEETSKSSIVAQIPAEEISKVSTVPSESTPPSTEEISAPLRSPNLPEATTPMSVTLASKDVPLTPEQRGQEECVSCPIASAPVPTKPEVPKQDITTENILPEPQIISSPPTQEAQQQTKQVDSKQEVTPEATSCKRTPPTTPSTEAPLCTPVQIPPPETPAKEENIIDPAAQALPSPPEQPVQKVTPVVEASQSIPLTEKILEKTPSLTEASAPTECSKPKETPAHIEQTPAEGKTCSLEKAPASTAQASAPLVPPEKPSAPSEPTSTISLASDEPPPPIAPPPRKSGGKKNQSKPKK
ncbi:glycogenin-2 isoform X2 [Coccinella septempunctata]|uniref:glycogenin-2 isoform X2 n=1 Tax=Coccinella septempunctata TaxID=41139 RepID=UPI001D06286E|nr:glycogenin-2 isoform X2 [Coccinella septempunctata]